MDIISHGLWAGALSKIVKLKKRKFNFWFAAFWGMFPDIFAFVIPFIIWIFALLFGIVSLPDSINLGATPSTFPYYNIIEILYNISHSLIIFSGIFLLVYLIFQKPIWIMFGWLLHILIDMFTHIREHFPTPILWPLSNFKINGLIYWRNPWFMVGDVVLLIIVYCIIFLRKKRKK
jgi:hypothetical protein